MRRFALLLAASALALEKVPLKRQVTTRRRLSVGGRTDLKTCDDNVFYAEAALGTPPQTFQLLIDTGSADLWVAATNCEDVQGGNGGCPMPAMGWLLVFVVVGLVAAAVMCLVCRKRRSSARLNSEDNWQAQWSQVSSTTPAGGAVELHQVGVRNPMADDREKGFSDVNLGV